MSDARPPRSQKPKQPERVYGDWKEFRSSSNRVYYWNYRTTVNTWEKPKDWNDEKATVVKKDRNGHRSHQVNGHSRSHHHSRPKTELPPNDENVKKLMESLKNPSSTPMHPKKRWRKVEDPADTATPPTKPRLSENNHQRPPPTVEKTPDEMVEEKYGYLFRSNRESRVKQFQVNAPELHFETAPFETLRPFYDTNLVAPDVRALLQEQNTKQVSEMLPKKYRLTRDLAVLSTGIKHQRASIRHRHVLRCVEDTKLINCRKVMRELILGDNAQPPIATTPAPSTPLSTKSSFPSLFSSSTPTTHGNSFSQSSFPSTPMNTPLRHPKFAKFASASSQS